MKLEKFSTFMYIYSGKSLRISCSLGIQVAGVFFLFGLSIHVHYYNSLYTRINSSHTWTQWVMTLGKSQRKLTSLWTCKEIKERSMWCFYQKAPWQPAFGALLWVDSYHVISGPSRIDVMPYQALSQGKNTSPQS